MARVVLTDHPWPDVDLERALFDAAGYELVAGPAGPVDAGEVERAVAHADPSAIMTCWAPVSVRAIEAPAQLSLVARIGVGLDNIAVDAATRRGAWVTNVPDYCVEEVSDHALALILDHVRGISRLTTQTRAGRWEPGAATLYRLAEATVGIVGYGRIGRATARKLAAFRCTLLVHDPSAERRADADATFVTLEEIARRCDVIVLHLPLKPHTRHLIGPTFLARVERAPLLVNVSRGGLVDTAALIAALDDGRVRAAALDVLEEEPVVPAALRERPNVSITPHVGFSSLTSVVELRRRACEEVIRVVGGEPPRFPCNAPVR